MKKSLLVTIVLLSVNLVFAFEKNNKKNFFSEKTNDFSICKNPSIPLGFSKSFPTANDKKEDKGGAAFTEGVVVITAGYGWPNLGRTWLKIYESELDYKATGIGPLHFKGEYGLSDKIGMGLSVNYVSSSASYTEMTTDTNNNPVMYTYKFAFSSVSVLARMNIHFATSEKMDPYWGIGAGFRTGGFSLSSNDPNMPTYNSPTFLPVGFETTIGLRYYFTDNIGAYIEMGIAKSIIQGGLAFKF